MKKYKIAYATGSRADYGIVKKYLHCLDDDKNIDFSVLVTGAHMEKRFGSTVSNIEEDGFKIDLRVDLKINTSTTASILNSVAIATKEFGEYFETNKYDLLIILGDRYEMLAVAQAAAMQKIPILHLHGGEVTYGNYDEFIRHSITKMSRFHFASTETYKNRIIRMGEYPDYVFNMGALGAENCTKINKALVSDKVKELPRKEYFVVVFHPETLTNIDLREQADIVIRSLDKIPDRYKIIFMGTNADTKSDIIQSRWIEYAKTNNNVIYVESLNADSYLYLVKNSVCLIGNSSSGIIEAPSLGAYSVNIGDRQKGRVHGESVLDVPCNEDKIIEAINKIIEENMIVDRFENPYYQENAAQRCYEKTKEILNIDISKPKEFYDM